MNKIQVTNARLGADPVLSTVSGGQQVCKFRIACNNKHRNEDNTFDSNWYNCTAWGKQGETISKYFHKGNRINVAGDLTIRDYVDKNGAARVSVDIDVRDFDFVDSAQSTQGAAPAQAKAPARPAAPAPSFTPAEAPDDELPF